MLFTIKKKTWMPYQFFYINGVNNEQYFLFIFFNCQSHQSCVMKCFSPYTESQVLPLASVSVFVRRIWYLYHSPIDVEMLSTIHRDYLSSSSSHKYLHPTSPLDMQFILNLFTREIRQ